jgi:hypothetical protein
MDRSKSVDGSGKQTESTSQFLLSFYWPAAVGVDSFVNNLRCPVLTY